MNKCWKWCKILQPYACSCLAVHDLLRGRALDDVVESLPELWESCLRVLDDIKESVRKAADMACTTLSRV